jgi:hypothetical protein
MDALKRLFDPSYTRPYHETPNIISLPSKTCYITKPLDKNYSDKSCCKSCLI